MFEPTNEQYLSPTDDEYEMSGVDPETGEVKGMSWDTTPEFRAKLDEELKDQMALEMYEAYENAENK